MLTAAELAAAEASQEPAAGDSTETLLAKLTLAALALATALSP